MRSFYFIFAVITSARSINTYHGRRNLGVGWGGGGWGVYESIQLYFIYIGLVVDSSACTLIILDRFINPSTCTLFILDWI